MSSYLDALRNRADAYRRQYGPGTGPPAPIVHGGRSFASGTPSALEAAQAEVTRQTRAVSAVAGRMDPLDLPPYEVIRDAARGAPVAYLAAADTEGYALIVRDAGEPGFIRLPGMHPDELGRHVAAFTVPSPLPNAVRRCVEWLAGPVLAPLLPEFAADPEIALVPLGGLNLLPVNAALLQATAGRPDGPLCVRYLPNARTADREPPWPAGSLPRDVLIVDVAQPPGGERLQQAAQEAGALAARYGARRLSNPRRQEVLSALAGADLVQFLCHGKADLTDPLAGGLWMMDGWLTVRTLMERRPQRPQLVILAACESQAGGTAAPDEMLGLPAALYQAGAAGVIAAQWQVDERAALLLLRRFHDHLADGRSPARALCAAQGWLRTATIRQISDSCPDLLRPGRRRGRAPMAAERDAYRPYAEPVFWAAFGYTGV